MRTVLLASLRHHARRYVSAVLAVVVGVGFVVVTASLSSATKDGLTAGVALPYEGADVVVRGQDGASADALVRGAADHGAEASVLGWTVERVQRDGVTIDDVDVAHLADDPALRWPELVEGAFPEEAGEVALDTAAAERLGVGLGDRLQVGEGARTAHGTVTAMVDSPSPLVSADLYLTWEDLAPFTERLFVDSVAWRGPASGVTALDPDAEVVPVGEFVAERQTEVDSGVDVVTAVLLLFATIALVVGVLVIANTFSILFAQRSHDLALLRCVGATRRQVLRSIRLESLVLGLVASTLALVLGTLAGRGAVAAIGARWPDAGLGDPAVGLGWYGGAFVVGLVVTLVASWLPTRRAVRADPLAALRPETGVDVRAAGGRVRLALGVTGLVGGALLLLVAVRTTSVAVLMLGGVTLFAGVVVLTPWLVPAMVRALGAAGSRVLGVPGRLAAGNAVRHPRRTAATATSLLVGVTLTTAVLTGMASSRGALADEMDAQHPLDAVVVAPRDAIPSGLAETVAGLDGVAEVTEVAGVVARVPGRPGTRVPVLAVSDPEAGRDASALRVPEGGVRISYDLLDGDWPERLALAVGDRTERLRVDAGEGWGEAALVSPAALDRLVGAGGATETRALWVRADDGADADELGARLEALARPFGGEVANGLEKRAYVDLQLDVLTGAVVGLLGIAVLIALVGIANTLGLSVLERAREHALLRAVGLTGRQLRATLALESVLLSVVATVLGTALGVLFGWAGVLAMVRTAIADAPVVVPLGQLSVVVLVSAVAGLLACVLPSRRAARVTPAAGLSLD